MDPYHHAQDQDDEQEVESMLASSISGVFGIASNALRNTGILPPLPSEPQSSTRPRPPPHEDAKNENVCRLCFSGDQELEDDGESLGDLISPCACDGSMKYVHRGCLDQWRNHSRSSDAASMCGQCFTRYRIKTFKWTSAVVFLDASQLFRLMAAFSLVALCVIVSGMLAWVSIKAVASVGPLRQSALGLVEPHNVSIHVELGEDRPDAIVYFHHPIQATSLWATPVVAHTMAQVDAFEKILAEKGNDPRWIVSDDESMGGNKTRSSRRQSSSRRGYVLTVITSRNMSQIATKLSEFHHRQAVGVERDGSGSSVQEYPQYPWREVVQYSNFRSRLSISSDNYDHLLQRIKPKWLGMGVSRIMLGLGYVIPANVFLSTLFISPLSAVKSLWLEFTRGSLMLLLLLTQSHKELLWFSAKLAVAALIAYIDQHWQAARPLPPNAILLGPKPSRSRRLAGQVRQVLVFSSEAVFGQYWLNWWGGYSLSVYLPRDSFTSSERVEFAILAPILYSVFDLVSIAIALVLEFSVWTPRWLTKIQSRLLDRKTKPYLATNNSAAEGYRRMISVLLGNTQEAQETKYDAILAYESELFSRHPGKTLPLTMAKHAQQDVWQTILALGSIVVVTLALGHVMYLVWNSLLKDVAYQVAQLVQQQFYLIKYSISHLYFNTVARASDRIVTWWRRRRMASKPIQQAAAGESQQQQQQQQYEPMQQQQQDIAHQHVIHHARAVMDDNEIDPVPAILAAQGLAPGARPNILNAMTVNWFNIHGLISQAKVLISMIRMYLAFLPFYVSYSFIESSIHNLIVQQEIVDRNQH